MFEENVAEIARQRALHVRARSGDRQALAELYRSFLPLIKSRVGRVLRSLSAEGGLAGLGPWYDADDLLQDSFLVFHRFVMVSDPQVPLYRLVAGAFERALRRHLRARRTSAPEEPLPNEEADPRPARGPSAFEVACAVELLAALDSDDERTLALLFAQGYSGRALADLLGVTPAVVQGRRCRLRARLVAHGIGPR